MAEAPDPAANQARLWRVLVAEDDPDLQVILEDCLTLGGLEVTMAENGKVALERAEQGGYDLLLLDIMMPVMDGYETLRRLQLTPAGRALPVVLLTAKSPDAKWEQGARDWTNVVGYLRKPFDPDEIALLLKNFLG